MNPRLYLACVLVVVLCAKIDWAQEAPRKKVIVYGWGTPETMYVRDHWQEMEQMPLDGAGITVAIDREAWQKGKRDTGNQLAWKLFGPQAFRMEDFTPAIADLKAAQWQRLRDNFLAACICSTGQDFGFNWFDDSRWKTVLNNWRILVTIAKEGGCKGIILDPEHYGTYFFCYLEMRSRADKSFAECQAKLRQRGRELMQATREIFPEITLLMFWAHSYLALHPSERIKPLEKNSYGLLPAFVDGMLEGADSRARFADVCEFAYAFKERRQFEEARDAILNKAATFSAVPDLYRAKVKVGFGLWLDYGGAKNWNMTDFSKNRFTPEQFGQSLCMALELSDEYVWIYHQTPRFFPRSDLPDPYLGAIMSAREAAK